MDLGNGFYVLLSDNVTFADYTIRNIVISRVRNFVINFPQCS